MGMCAIDRNKYYQTTRKQHLSDENVHKSSTKQEADIIAQHAINKFFTSVYTSALEKEEGLRKRCFINTRLLSCNENSKNPIFFHNSAC